MIEVKNLVKTFDGFRALDDLTMTVPRGAVYGLVGPNGAGKSTLLRHLTGIYRPDSGTVTVDGEPVFENPAVKRRIAYIPDDVFYFRSASIADMASFFAGACPTFDWERYEKLRKAFDLDEKQPIRRFSKGMQKQAAFWLAMSLAPDVLVLDEPVDGLDPVMRRQVWSLVMADVADCGTTVLVSSHNLRELEDVCDHVGILDRGKLLLERSLSDLQENIVKVMIALPEGQALPQDLNILHDQTTGRMHTLILRGDADALEAYLAAAQPQYMDVVPLTLEEIFIYELGGVDYEVKNILL
ncbi:MAG: ABC transporter ATP-binding protein [Oscillospiraceae bacterium]|nr:ABC transporter ATP-binding protein [Oscillospiraceae bacterium]